MTLTSYSFLVRQMRRMSANDPRPNGRLIINGVVLDQGYQQDRAGSSPAMTDGTDMPEDCTASKPAIEPVYSIGDLASALCVSARAIRFYEDQGMLAPQRAGGNRVYSPRDFARLKLILRGKRLGFSLADIRELLDLYDVDRNHLEQLRRTLNKGRERIEELERQQVELTLTLAELRDFETTILTCIQQREAEGQSPTSDAVEEKPEP